MSSVNRVATGVLALGLALSGCGSEGAPRMGGVAAEVAGETITLDDVNVLTDALCTSNLATGDTRYTRPRSQMQNDALGALLQIAIVKELGLAEDAQNNVDVDQVPGWADMSNGEQRELKEFLDGDARLRTALEQLGGSTTQSPEEAAQAGLETLAERADEAGIEATVNPRFELQVDDGAITGTRELSTPVSDEATAGEEPDLGHLASLPDAQLCGVRPEPGVAG